MDDREASIEWQVCLKEAGETVRVGRDTMINSNPLDMAAMIIEVTNILYTYRQSMFSAAQTPVARPSGPPPPDAPYGEEPPPHPGSSSGPPAAHICGRGRDDTEGCGAELKYFTQGDYSGYECPNRKKTRDPAEQAAEKVRHPTQWL